MWVLIQQPNPRRLSATCPSCQKRQRIVFDPGRGDYGGSKQTYRCEHCAYEWTPRITAAMFCGTCNRPISVEYDPSAHDPDWRALFCPYPGCHEIALLPGEVPGLVLVVRIGHPG